MYKKSFYKLGSAHIPQANEEIMTLHENPLETREYLLMKRVLLKPKEEVQEPTQRKMLFKTMCKSNGKCCKVIIDSESIDNLVSMEMVDRLGLRKTIHPTLYKLSWFHKGHQVLVNV